MPVPLVESEGLCPEGLILANLKSLGFYGEALCITPPTKSSPPALSRGGLMTNLPAI
jgi:hypothetical protein